MDGRVGARDGGPGHGAKPTVAGGRASAATTRGTPTRVDDRVAQFLVSVGRLCGDAHLGGFAVRLTLLDDSELRGVPEPPAETDGAGQLDDTGFADQLSVDGVVVALSDVAEASIERPGG